jgi:SAM-dependent methyltransferase
MNAEVLNAGPLRDPGTERAWRSLHAVTSARYRASGLFAWQFARGKLGLDPVFRGVLEHGDLAGRARIVDLGCGQGLIASLLQSCADLDRVGAWPAAWQQAPMAQIYTGVELMPRDVVRAESALTGLRLAPRFACADMREAALARCDLAILLDVLHYIDHDSQRSLLARVRVALAPHGRLLLRVGDMAQRRAYAISQWVDHAVTRMRGHRVAPTWGRSVANWTVLLESLGFAVRARPMSRGTPFANVLLIADLGAPGA